MNPLCFVLMPFGKKKDKNGKEIDFDTIYQQLILPAIEDAKMEAIRADEEMVGGFIHKPMFERLLLCDYAIADLTTANANVFYELGVRHTAKPFSTLSIFAKDCQLPFDVSSLRSYPYSLDSKRELDKIEQDRAYITKWLNEARNPVKDSPLFQFFDEMKPHQIDVQKSQAFRKRVEYSLKITRELQKFRDAKDLEGLIAFEQEQNLEGLEGGVLVEMFIAYRALEAWDNMIALSKKMPPYLQQSLRIKEQLAFALNRAGEDKEAEQIFIEILKEYGDNSETLGLLGRIYKDRWKKETNPILKKSWLKKSIDTYIQGFKSDPRDAYPGVNAITLMLTLEDEDPRLKEILPVVLFATKQRLEQSNPDYWDYATLMELEVASRHKKEALDALYSALPLVTEDWMTKTTLDTIVMLRDKWLDSGEDVEWLDEILEGLMGG